MLCEPRRQTMYWECEYTIITNNFTITDLLGQDYYDSLDSAEQSFIDFKFHELILRGEIMNVVIKEESEHDKHRYNIKLNQFKLKQKVCRTSF